MRLRVLGAMTAAAFGLAAVTSCLLDIPDVAGDADTPDVIGLDVDSGGDVDDASIDVPPACATLDASACLPDIPDGWSPVLLPAADAGCRSGWNERDLVTNPQLSGCSCTCNVFGSYNCNNVSMSASTGPTCTTAVSLSEGICHQGTTANYGFATKPMAGGSPSCNSPNAKGQVSSDAVPTCSPVQCDLDFCSAQGRKCIEGSGAATCPSGYPASVTAGTGAKATCPSCSCKVDPPSACDVTLGVYTTLLCGGQPLGSTSTPGTCNLVDAGSTNMKFTATYGGMTTCSTTASGDASVSLNGLTTICCTN